MRGLPLDREGDGRLGLTPEEMFVFDLQGCLLLKNVLTVYQSKLISSNIATDAHFEDNEKITIRKGELMQVFSNIVANAIDAMPKGGRLTVCTGIVGRSQGRGVEVAVRDSGVGIRPEQLERVFEPFFTTKGDLGTGVGLWVARQLVTNRGGDITLTSSREPGTSGTEVNIFLPFELPKPVVTQQKH